MKLTESNLKVFKHHKGFALKIIMPDGSDNYLHCGDRVDINDTIIQRELLMDMDIDHTNLHIKEEVDGYFRLELRIEDCNDDKHYFHSRKLNINDAVFERMQLLVADD